MCGLNCTYIGGIERGERNVALVNVEKIAKAFRISLSELFRAEFDSEKINWAMKHGAAKDTSKNRTLQKSKHAAPRSKVKIVLAR